MTRDVFTCQPPPIPGMLAQLARLRADLPGYDVIITSHSGQHRYEAIRRPGHTGPWCIISAGLVGQHSLRPGS